MSAAGLHAGDRWTSRQSNIKTGRQRKRDRERSDS